MRILIVDAKCLDSAPDLTGGKRKYHVEDQATQTIVRIAVDKQSLKAANPKPSIQAYCPLTVVRGMEGIT